MAAERERERNCVSLVLSGRAGIELILELQKKKKLAGGPCLLLLRFRYKASLGELRRPVAYRWYWRTTKKSKRRRRQGGSSGRCFRWALAALTALSPSSLRFRRRRRPPSFFSLQPLLLSSPKPLTSPTHTTPKPTRHRPLRPSPLLSSFPSVQPTAHQSQCPAPVPPPRRPRPSPRRPPARTRGARSPPRSAALSRTTRPRGPRTR